MERASRPPGRGDRAALEEIARSHPYAYTFVSDEELAMLAEIGRASTATQRPLWGCEQAFGATLYLEELSPLAPSPPVRALVDALLERAREAERPVRDLAARHCHVSRSGEDRDAPVPARRVGAARGMRAAELLDALLKSDEIYGYYARAKAGEVVGLRNNTVREADMKDRFRREYRLAEEEGRRGPEGAPEVRSRSRAARPESDERVQHRELRLRSRATFEGMKSFHVAILHYGTVAELERYKGAGSFLARLAPAEGWELLDLRPLQPWVHARKLDGDIPEADRASVRDFLFSFDAILFMSHGRRGTYSVTGAKY